MSSSGRRSIAGNAGAPAKRGAHAEHRAVEHDDDGKRARHVARDPSDAVLPTDSSPASAKASAPSATRNAAKARSGRFMAVTDAHCLDAVILRRPRAHLRSSSSELTRGPRRMIGPPFEARCTSVHRAPQVTITSSVNSVELDAFGLHHVAPVGDRLGHPAGEFLGAAGADVAAELDDLVGDLRRSPAPCGSPR